jgi:hypothetical protein
VFQIIHSKAIKFVFKESESYLSWKIDEERVRANTDNDCDKVENSNWRDS